MRRRSQSVGSPEQLPVMLDQSLEPGKAPLVLTHGVSSDDPWFCIRSNPNQEVRAAAHISQSHPVLLPRYLHTVHNGYRLIESTRPLFPSYLFAQFSPDEYLGTVNNTRGVKSVVSLSGQPVIVPTEVIHEIESRIGPDGLVELFGDVLTSARLQVVSGPFAGFEGAFVRETPAKDRVWILLRVLGRETETEMARGNVRAV